MKKLENIPKKIIFEVPDGYFDRLPSIIQSRIAEKKSVERRVSYFSYALKYALPVIAVAAALFYFYRPRQQDAESILASVETSELITYLEQTEITTEELLLNIELDEEGVQAIEDEVYIDINDADIGLNELEEQI